jgi:hypothetical protein
VWNKARCLVSDVYWWVHVRCTIPTYVSKHTLFDRRKDPPPITHPHPPKRPFGVLSRALDPLHTFLLRNAFGAHHDAATLHVGVNTFVRVAVCMLGSNWHSTEETYNRGVQTGGFSPGFGGKTSRSFDAKTSRKNPCVETSPEVLLLFL